VNSELKTDKAADCDQLLLLLLLLLCVLESIRRSAEDAL